MAGRRETPRAGGESILGLLDDCRAGRASADDVERRARGYSLAIRHEYTEGGVRRLVLSRPRGDLGSAPLAVYECNGLVVDTRDWRVLAVPPKSLRYRARSEEVDRGLRAGHYRGTLARDGTMCTIYFWEGAWCVASANGYDVSGFRRVGRLTYAEALHEALAPWGEALGLAPLEEGRLVLGVGRDLSYTVCFWHPELHAGAEAPGAVLHHCSDATGRPVAGVFGGLPGPAALDLAGLRAADLVRRSEELQPPWMGCVLQSQDYGATGRCSFVVYPSPAMNLLRDLFYADPAAGDLPLAAEERRAYAHVRAFLGAEDREAYKDAVHDAPAAFARLRDLMAEVIRTLTHSRFDVAGRRTEAQRFALDTLLPAIRETQPKFVLRTAEDAAIAEGYARMPRFRRDFLRMLQAASGSGSAAAASGGAAASSGDAAAAAGSPGDDLDAEAGPS